jgi:NTP pyrophosphatase (non-canonical NTP hydrolase)
LALNGKTRRRLKKVEEEIGELHEAINENDQEHIEEELW